jgi:hypothetical protein
MDNRNDGQASFVDLDRRRTRCQGIAAVHQGRELNDPNHMKDQDMPNEAAIEQEIQDKGLTAPRLTPALIDDTILSEVAFTAFRASVGQLDGLPDKAQLALSCLTICVLVLKNGFTVTGESACASPENFDFDLGVKIARENARNKIWALEGYALKNRLAGI